MADLTRVCYCDDYFTGKVNPGMLHDANRKQWERHIEKSRGFIYYERSLSKKIRGKEEFALFQIYILYVFTHAFGVLLKPQWSWVLF